MLSRHGANVASLLSVVMTADTLLRTYWIDTRGRSPVMTYRSRRNGSEPADGFTSGSHLQDTLNPRQQARRASCAVFGQAWYRSGRLRVNRTQSLLGSRY